MQGVPLTEFSYLAKDIYVKTRKSSQIMTLTCENLQGSIKSWSQSGELVNNISILTEIDECIEKNSEKLKEVEDNSIKSKEQR